MKTVQKLGHIFTQENWEELLESADSLYDERGDGWDAFVEQHLEEYCECCNQVQIPPESKEEKAACEFCEKTAELTVVEDEDGLEWSLCDNCADEFYYSI